jgi:hypothetical protein
MSLATFANMQKEYRDKDRWTDDREDAALKKYDEQLPPEKLAAAVERLYEYCRNFLQAKGVSSVNDRYALFADVMNMNMAKTVHPKAVIDGVIERFAAHGWKVTHRCNFGYNYHNVLCFRLPDDWVERLTGGSPIQ